MSDAPVVGHYLNGHVQDRDSTRFGNVFNPATGAVQARVALAEPGTVDAAVASALAAFPAWSEQSSLRRSRVMFKFKELLDRHHDELAQIISREHGRCCPMPTAKLPAASRLSSTLVVRRTCSRLISATTSAAASTTGTCANPWAFVPGSRRSTSR